MPAAFQFNSVKDLLVCPVTHATLVCPDQHRLVSTDPQTRLSYAIDDGIPVLLPDAGTELEPGEWAELMRSEGRDPQTGGPRTGDGPDVALSAGDPA